MNMKQINVIAVSTIALVWGAVSPAKAIEFSLSGSLANGDTFGGEYTLSDQVANGSAVSSVQSFSQYDINVYDASHQTIDTFTEASANGFPGAIIGDLSSQYGVQGSLIEFGNNLPNGQKSILQVVFANPITSYSQPLLGPPVQGLYYGGFLLNGYTSTSNGITTQVTSATEASTAAPEPKEILGTLCAIGMGVALRMKKRLSSIREEANSAAV